MRRVDTDLFFLALAEEDLDECILPIQRSEWLKSEARVVETTSTQMRKTTFLPVLAALNIRNMTGKNQVQGGVQMYRNVVSL